jgi:OmpA-OmpF porin, OOP family
MNSTVLPRRKSTMARRLLVALFVLGMATAVAHAGLYAGASVGQTGLKASDSNVDISDSATAYKIYGGWGGKFFGFEGSYIDFGSASDESGGVDAKISTTGYDVFVKGSLPLGKHIELFAKAGIVFWSADTKLSGAVSDSSSDSGNDGVYGAGVAWKFGEHLRVRGEYERYDISGLDSLHVTSVGADFGF